MMKNLHYKTLTFIAALICIISCSGSIDGPSKGNSQDHHWVSELTNTPKGLIRVTNGSGDLFAQSISGVVNKALKNKQTEYGVWLNLNSSSIAYNRCLGALKDMGVDITYKSTTPSGLLDCKEIKSLIKGYILTDVENNPESAVYAANAAHVLDAAIVDIKNESKYNRHNADGSFPMLCDARKKSTEDAWKEFKDKCNNNGLVVMSVATPELRDLAIAQELFIINLNKVQNTPAHGQNAKLLQEILAWLKPASPVYGWEGGVNEDVFVGKVSQYGHMMVPYDWAYNTVLTSLNYSSQQQTLPPYSDPKKIDFNEKSKKYVSFYLSDGDNVQWMLNNFENSTYYDSPLSTEMRMGYGVDASNLSMIAPAHFYKLMENRREKCSVIETFGGGYYYVDTFGKLANRETALDLITKRVAKHMQSQGLKVLALMSLDIDCEASKEAYQKYISSNDQLDGIIAMQYSPYAAGNGVIMWFKNSKGIDIPVITVKYTLWNFKEYNQRLEGSPTYIANKVNAESGSSPFSLLCVHAWSRFANTGDNPSETLESTTDGNCIGASAAKLCVNKLDKDTKIINVDELVWRVRMHYREEQTKEVLSKL